MSKSTGSSQHSFAQIPSAEIQRSTFDRSHAVHTTFRNSLLTPIFVDEALPGDTINLNLSLFARFATPLVPFMDNVFVETQYWAVPYRLLWDNWAQFNGEQANPGDSTDFTVPQISSGTAGFPRQSLWDYFGIPPLKKNVLVNSWAHRGYNLIIREWYRDENLQDSPVVDTDDTPDVKTDYVLWSRGKRKDYLTGCLPWPSKGEPVPLPLGTTAPVIPDPNAANPYPTFNNGNETSHLVSLNASTDTRWFDTATTSGDMDWDTTGLVADLENATAATINALREAFTIQQLYERDARGGTRYTELLRSHFGVTSPDARLQRPEYLGGSSTRVNVNPVAQTSQSDTTPQGELAAYATASNSNGVIQKSFTEHCLILGLVSARAEISYQQNLDRMWQRQSRWDHYWPALAHLGEQAVKNSEIYLQGSDGPAGEDDETFGYQERWAEYRYKNSMITGAMRSSAALPLDSWHLAEDFDSLPTLGEVFVESNPPFDRVQAVSASEDFILHLWYDYKHTRPIPTYSVPGLMARF